MVQGRGTVQSGLYACCIGLLRLRWDASGLHAIDFMRNHAADFSEDVPDDFKSLLDDFFRFHPVETINELDLSEKKIFLNGHPLCFYDKPESYIKMYYSLLAVQAGRTITYSGIAEKAGLKNSARAAGTAMAKNPLPLLVPCHRVVPATGKPGRYTPGDDLKITLLKNEGAL